MSVSIGLGDSSWQRASSQFPARLSVGSPRLGTASLSTAVGWVTPLSLLGPAAGSIPVPAAPIALCRVSLSCSDNHKKLFHFVAFLYLKNKQAIHPRGGQLQTTYKPSVCRSDHLSSAFPCQQGHHNVTLGILSADSPVLCRAKRWLQPHKAPALPGRVIRASVVLPVGFTVSWGFFGPPERVQLVLYSPALPCDTGPPHASVLSADISGSPRSGSYLGVVLCPSVASTTMPNHSATPLSSGAFRIPAIAFTHGPSFFLAFWEGGV